MHDAGVLPGRGVGQHRLQAAGWGGIGREANHPYTQEYATPIPHQSRRRRRRASGRNNILGHPLAAVEADDKESGPHHPYPTPNAEHRLSGAQKPKKESAMSGIGRKIIYVMLVIVVLLIIWQFLGSL